MDFQQRWRLGRCAAQSLGLQIIVAQHQVANLTGHLLEQLGSLLGGQIAALDHAVEQYLDVDLVVRAVHTGRVVNCIGVDTPARGRKLDAGMLSEPEIAALTNHPAAQLRCIHTQGVVGAITGVGVLLVFGLGVGADTTIPEQIDRGFQDRIDELGGRQAVSLDVERFSDFGRQRNRLCRTLEDTPSLGDQLRVVVGPAGARQLEQTFALIERFRSIWTWIQEDVQMIEGGDKPDVLGQQHAIAKNITSHVANAHDREVSHLTVDPELTEMALHRFPNTLGSDAHGFVVITHGAAGGKRVAKPMVVVDGDLVGVVGEGRRSLVGGYHQVGVVTVMTNHVGWRNDIAAGEIVGDIEQTLDEGLVAGNSFFQERVTPAGAIQLLRHKTTLRADRHDDRVLDHLGLHQAQHLSPEVLLSVRPAHPPASDRAAAQVNALDPWRIDKNLVHGPWVRQVRHFLRVELEGEIGFWPSLLRTLIEVGPHGGQDETQEAAQNPVFV